jgi:hypothetical protein
MLRVFLATIFLLLTSTGFALCNVDSDCEFCKNHEKHTCDQSTFKCKCVHPEKKDKAKIAGATTDFLAN